MHLLTDHPGWTDSGARVVRTSDGPRIVSAVTLPLQSWDGTAGLMVDVHDPVNLGEGVPERLRKVLYGRGPVARLRNPDLWDALATAIIRQVIRAGQARLMYQRFSAAFGESVTRDGNRLRAFPAPETVLAVSDAEYARLGMAFKRRPLRAAAEAFLDLGDKWASLPPTDLVTQVQSVHRIGPWTAGAAVADHTGDFSRYPCGDLAVRTCAAQAAPGLAWPDSEPEFAARWKRCTTTPRELSTLTVLTLALGGRRAQEYAPD